MTILFSIRTKILIIVVGVIVSAFYCDSIYTAKFFAEEKLQQTYEVTKAQVGAVASELDAIFSGVKNTFELLTVAYVSLPHKETVDTFLRLLEGDPLLVHMRMYKQTSSEPLELRLSATKKKFSEETGLRTEFFDSIYSATGSLPIEQIKNEKSFIWNATLDKGPALIGIGYVFVEGETTRVLVGLMRGDLLLSRINNNRLTATYLVDRDGVVMVHPDENLAKEKKILREDLIVQAAMGDSQDNGVSRYKDGETEYLGAFEHLGFGRLSVIAEMPYETARTVQKKWVQKLNPIHSLAVTAAFFLALLLGQSVVRGISRIRKALDLQIQDKSFGPLKVKRFDETRHVVAKIDEWASVFAPNAKDNRSKASDTQPPEGGGVG